MSAAMEREVADMIVANVPADWQPHYTPSMGGYNVSGWGTRCKRCGLKLARASFRAGPDGGWDCSHLVSNDTDVDRQCLRPEPLPAANVGRNGSGSWSLMDPWGSVWAFGFQTRDQAARFACALVKRHAIGKGAPNDWIGAK